MNNEITNVSLQLNKYSPNLFYDLRLQNLKSQMGVCILFLLKESDLNLSREMLQCLPSSLSRVHQPEFACMHVCYLNSMN